MVDPSPYNTWSNWGAYQRGLFFLNSYGQYVADFTITPWDYDGHIDTSDLVYSQIQSIIDIALNIHSHPRKKSLLSAYPNPFNSSANIMFSIPHSSYSTISIYDMNGRYFETLSKAYLNPGNYVLQWDASNLASGSYIIKFSSGKEIYNKKIVLAK